MGLNLKDDIIFKAFFTKKGNEKYLKSFLESILQEKISKIEIIRRSKSATTKKSRQTRKTRHKSNHQPNKNSKHRNPSKKQQKHGTKK